jgi:RNase H-like domain found in reverse transcriptase/Reverse transcriptase (RNA-dependent DNA polymerase)
MSKILGDLDFCTFFMDDIHIGGVTEKDMLKNLKIVFERVHQNHLKVRLSKTKFYEKQCKLLGMIFSNVGKQVDPEEVKAIENFGPLDSVKKVQAFLGMVCYLSSFIPHFSSSCTPLFNLLRDQKTKPFQLTQEAIDACEALKKYISKCCMLYHVDFNKPLYLRCDASNYACGAFLYQINIYSRTESGKQKMLEDLGFEICKESENYTPYLNHDRENPIHKRKFYFTY